MAQVTVHVCDRCSVESRAKNPPWRVIELPTGRRGTTGQNWYLCEKCVQEHAALRAEMRGMELAFVGGHCLPTEFDVLPSGVQFLDPRELKKYQQEMMKQTQEMRQMGGIAGLQPLK